MDSLTHVLAGAALAGSGLARRHGRGTTLFLIVASSLPDIDVAVGLLGVEDSFAFRRTLTHGVVGVPLLALLAALVFRRFRRDADVRTFFGLGLLAMALHVFMDLWNSYGVVVLFPFSMKRFELAWVFIIDLAIWGILLAPVLLRIIPRVRDPGKIGEALSRASLVALGLYVGVCAVGHSRALAVLDREITPSAVNLRAFPEPFGPRHWRGVALEGDTYRVWLIDAWARSADLREAVATQADEPAVEAARQTTRGRRLDWFFASPVWRLLPGGREVEVFDLRFQSLLVSRGSTAFRQVLPVPAAFLTQSGLSRPEDSRPESSPPPPPSPP